MPNDIFVICEQRDNIIQEVSFQLLGEADKLAQITKKQICAVIMGSGIKNEAKKLIGYGADIVYVVDDKNLKHYLTEQYAQAVYQIIKEHQPDIVLYGATSIGRDLAPRLSAMLKTGLTADCTKLEVDTNGVLYMTRPAFGGNLFATIICPDHRPQMSTVREGVMKKQEYDKNKTGEVKEVKIDFDTSKFKVDLIKEVMEETQTENIEEAEILVACGRGVKDDLKNIKEFAISIGALTCCSRALVDTGFMPTQKQVGQTGKTVRPSVYIALGISGAVQHLAGMEESDYIIAINNDREAPIFKAAHLGIVADAKAILPYLKEAILAAKSSKQAVR